jgi:hypothetical protein
MSSQSVHSINIINSESSPAIEISSTDSSIMSIHQQTTRPPKHRQPRGSTRKNPASINSKRRPWSSRGNQNQQANQKKKKPQTINLVPSDEVTDSDNTYDDEDRASTIESTSPQQTQNDIRHHLMDPPQLPPIVAKEFVCDNDLSDEDSPSDDSDSSESINTKHNKFELSQAEEADDTDVDA